MADSALPPGWLKLPVGEVATHIGSGVTPRGGERSYVAEGIPLLRSQNVHFGGLRLDDVARISPSVHKDMARSSVEPGDVLLNITGASIGRVCHVPLGFGPGNVNQHVCIIRVARELVAPGFLSAFLASTDGQNQINSLQAGLSREALNYQQVRAIQVLLPPLSEQRKIAAILSSVDETIEKTEAVITQLDVVKKAMLEELLTRGIPGRHSRFKMTEIGEVPEEWRVYPLGANLAGIEGGWSPQCEQRAAHADEWGVLKVSSVTSEIYRPEENKALPSNLAPRPDIEVRRGDVLVARANGVLDLVGRACYVEETRPRLMLSDKTLRLRPKDALDGFYLWLLLQCQPVRERLKSTTGGGYMRNLSQAALRAVQIALPAIDEQRAIATAVRGLVARDAAEHEVMTRLRECKDALATTLLSGELRVQPGAGAA